MWGLLVDGKYEPGLPPAEPYNIAIHTGDVRADVQASVAMLAPMLGMGQTYDISDEQARLDLSRVAVMVLSYAAQSARGLGKNIVPQSEVDQGGTLAEKFLIRWRGEADPAHTKAIDAYWSSAAEHGMNASTFTARVITSTGADVAAAFSGAIRAMSGPLHGGAPSRVLGMIQDVEKSGDAEAYVKKLLDDGERLMGFGHRVYRAEDPRARVLRRTAKELMPLATRSPSSSRSRPRRAQGASSGPRARDQRGVLGRDRARLRRGAGQHVHLDVHLCPHRWLVGAHPGAEAHRSADPPVRDLRRPRGASRQRHRGLERGLGRHRRLRAAGRLTQALVEPVATTPGRWFRQAQPPWQTTTVEEDHRSAHAGPRRRTSSSARCRLALERDVHVVAVPQRPGALGRAPCGTSFGSPAGRSRRTPRRCGRSR